VITSSTGAVRSEQSSHSKLESDITIRVSSDTLFYSKK